jgi:PRC-barrel domain
VDDFLVDQTRNVRYFVVDTSNWIGGDSVLVPSTAVEKVDPRQKKIYVKLTRAEVAACPLEDTVDIPIMETLGPTIL